MRSPRKYQVCSIGDGELWHFLVSKQLDHWTIGATRGNKNYHGTSVLSSYHQQCTKDLVHHHARLQVNPYCLLCNDNALASSRLQTVLAKDREQGLTQHINREKIFRISLHIAGKYSSFVSLEPSLHHQCRRLLLLWVREIHAAGREDQILSSSVSCSKAVIHSSREIPLHAELRNRNDSVPLTGDDFLFVSIDLYQHGLLNFAFVPPPSLNGLMMDFDLLFYLLHCISPMCINSTGKPFTNLLCRLENEKSISLCDTRFILMIVDIEIFSWSFRYGLTPALKKTCTLAFLLFCQ